MKNLLIYQKKKYVFFDPTVFVPVLLAYVLFNLLATYGMIAPFISPTMFSFFRTGLVQDTQMEAMLNMSFEFFAVYFKFFVKIVSIVLGAVMALDVIMITLNSFVESFKLVKVYLKQCFYDVASVINKLTGIVCDIFYPDFIKEFQPSLN